MDRQIRNQPKPEHERQIDFRRTKEKESYLREMKLRLKSSDSDQIILGSNGL